MLEGNIFSHSHACIKSCELLSAHLLPGEHNLAQEERERGVRVTVRVRVSEGDEEKREGEVKKMMHSAREGEEEEH